jgi:hypothetical protein
MKDVNASVVNPRDDYAPKADATLDRAHRAVLVALAAAAALVGAWAQVAPLSFYADFPGLRQFWVSLDGPYNEHLIRDVGGLNLGLAVLTAMAAVHGRARLARLAAACWLIFSVPHFVYHATHLGPFGAIDATAQVVSLALQVTAPLWVLLTTPAIHRNSG